MIEETPLILLPIRANSLSPSERATVAAAFFTASSSTILPNQFSTLAPPLKSSRSPSWNASSRFRIAYANVPRLCRFALIVFNFTSSNPVFAFLENAFLRCGINADLWDCMECRRDLIVLMSPSSGVGVLDIVLEKVDARPGNILRIKGFRQGAEAQNSPVLTSTDTQIPTLTRSHERSLLLMYLRIDMHRKIAARMTRNPIPTTM